MKRSIKRSFTLMFLFMACSLFSIGFSSWTILLDLDTNYTEEGYFETEDIISSDDYIEYEIDNSKMFKYCTYGFVDNDNNVVRKGTLPLKVTMKNLNTLKDIFNSEQYDSVKVFIVLKYNNANNAFKLYENQEDIYKFSTELIYDNTQNYDLNENNIVLEYSSNECDYNISLDSILDNEDVLNNNLQFNINYNFELLISEDEQAYTYFKNNLYNTINQLSLFTVSVKIEGYKASINAGGLNA